MKCKNCGSLFPDNVRFCLKCGEKLEVTNENDGSGNFSQDSSTAKDAEKGEDVPTVANP